jgi:hypothetical protein
MNHLQDISIGVILAGLAVGLAKLIKRVIQVKREIPK